MHTDRDPIDPSTLAELGYEHRDVPPRPLAWAAFWLFVFTIGSGILAAIFIRVWNIVPEVAVEQRAFQQTHPPLDTPILQNNSDNTADIATLRRNEAKVLNSNLDRKDGTYRITVDDAIKIIVQRGLPKTPTQTVTRPKPGEPSPVTDLNNPTQISGQVGHATNPPYTTGSLDIGATNGAAKPSTPAPTAKPTGAKKL